MKISSLRSGPSQFAHRSLACAARTALRSGSTPDCALCPWSFLLARRGRRPAGRPLISAPHHPLPAIAIQSSLPLFAPGTRSLSPRGTPDAHPSAPVPCKVVPRLHSQPLPALAALVPGASGPRRCPLAFLGLGRRRLGSARIDRGLPAVPGLLAVHGSSPPLKAFL